MKIIGINGLGILPSASLIIDGKLIAFAEEERFTRYKGSTGLMPSNAVNFCLNYGGLTLSDVDHIAFAWNSKLYRIYMPLFLSWKYLTRSPKFQSSSNLSAYASELIKFSPQNVKAKIFEMFRAAGIQEKVPKISFIPHHLSHAASSFYLSGMEKSHILVLDGSGEDTCTSVFSGNKTSIKFHKSIKVPDSLGWFYASFTEFLGFDPNNHEGKLMGLAAYGKHDGVLHEKMNIILKSLDNGKYKYNAKYSYLGKHDRGKVFSEDLCKLFGEPRKKTDPISDYHKDVAYAAQQRLEETVKLMVKGISSEKDFNGNLCIAGGVALNCKMNGVIAEMPEISNLYVPSCPGDAGAAIGAALILSEKFGNNPKQDIQHAYWGPEYSDSEIESMLIKCQIKYEYCDDIEIQVAKLLVENKIIGWFQGRMESGARALGARSILASPLLKDMKDIINLKVKNRENWRPFAASILHEYKNDFIIGEGDSPFMGIAFKVKPEAINKIFSAIHVDNTTRPQFVKKSVNERYWNTINEFGKLTGVHAVLNTSFNTNEEPIVENPMQAIKAFYGSGMDCLAIGSFLIKK